MPRAVSGWPRPLASQETRWRSRALFLTTGASIAVFLLYRFPPQFYSFYPRCPIHEYLHILCPGCGATRALSALLHGDVDTALHFNAFAVLVFLPCTAVYLAMGVKGFLKREAGSWPAIPRFAVVALVALSAAFTLYRNL